MLPASAFELFVWGMWKLLLGFSTVNHILQFLLEIPTLFNIDHIQCCYTVHTDHSMHRSISTLLSFVAPSVHKRELTIPVLFSGS